MTVHTWLATAAFGLEAVVARELQQLGYDALSVEDGKVRFQADGPAMCRANLWLRAADRVLWQLARFPARDFEELFSGIKAIAWEEILPVDAAFPVTAQSVRSQLHHEPSIQSVSKKAIVERLKQHYRRFHFQETGVEYPVEVLLHRDEVSVCLNTTGPGLHKRGYRLRPGAAPLRETTAAALVLLSYWNDSRPFLDPFCGSGTIVIEAALWARRLAPGLRRSFLAENWPHIPASWWHQARQEAHDLKRPRCEVPLLASDHHPHAIQAVQENATHAGVASDLIIKQQDALQATPPRDYGVLITNPPYGERLEDRRAVDQLYTRVTALWSQWPTWSFYVLTSHPRFERIFRRRADRRRKIYNGRIACTYYQFLGPRPPRSSSSEVAAHDCTPIDLPAMSRRMTGADGDA
ncbi:MAG: RNA methyltransferase [Planctomycetaceae bacterium]|nr:MAG: RNA methyltransferase [Planctomycetaceae bacterium]